jgi:protein-S-isoprenylcysteine O-methyltransferase Ste14
VGLVGTDSLLGHGPVTWTLQALAFLLLIWARVTFGRRSFHAAANPTAGGLVTTGPYAYVRHPIYAAILLFVWTGVAANPSWRSLALGLLATGMTAVRIFAEEKMVRAMYPEYEEYAKRVKRVVPGIM